MTGPVKTRTCPEVPIGYSITPPADTMIGVDTSASDYDTVVSVYTGACGALTSVACNDDFANSPTNQNRALLAFQARAGATYLIEVTGKGSGGTLHLRVTSDCRPSTRTTYRDCEQ